MTETEKRNYRTLCRIMEDMDPEDFGARELVQEFSNLTGADTCESTLRFSLLALQKAEYVERIERGRYRVTELGRSFYTAFQWPAEDLSDVPL